LYNGGLAGADVVGLAVDPGDPTAPYAVTWDGGVFKNITQ
jgi:hypothetical protein